MNRYKTLLLLIGLNIFSCEKDPINYEISLIRRDGVYYSKDTNLPYNGQVFSMYESGKIKTKGRFKDGKAHGLTIDWYKNEKKKSELNFKN